MKKFIFYIFNGFIISLFLLVKWISFTFNGSYHRFTTSEEVAQYNLIIWLLIILLFTNIYFAYKETKK